MTIDEMIDVLKAAKEGKVIQARGRYPSVTAWRDVEKPGWDFRSCDYRVKPTAPREVYVLKDVNEEAVWSTTIMTPELWERLTPEDQTKWTRFVEAES